MKSFVMSWSCFGLGNGGNFYKSGGVADCGCVCLVLDRTVCSVPDRLSLNGLVLITQRG